MITKPILEVSRSYDRLSALLSWKLDEAATEYEIYMQKGLNNLHMVKYATVMSSDFTSEYATYFIKNLQEIILYSFKIKAISENDFSDFSNVETDF